MSEKEKNPDNSIKVPKKRGRKPKSETLKQAENNVISEIKDEVKIPKKRGRKPKIKTEEDSKPKVLQKRGRKPKVKDPNEPEKIPKKRGRKPKDKTIIPITSNINTESDNIIIHLPINTSSIKQNREYTIHKSKKKQ